MLKILISNFFTDTLEETCPFTFEDSGPGLPVPYIPLKRCQRYLYTFEKKVFSKGISKVFLYTFICISLLKKGFMTSILVPKCFILFYKHAIWVFYYHFGHFWGILDLENLKVFQRYFCILLCFHFFDFKGFRISILATKCYILSYKHEIWVFYYHFLIFLGIFGLWKFKVMQLKKNTFDKNIKGLATLFWTSRDSKW